MSDSSLPDVQIVVACWNDIETTRTCLDKLSILDYEGVHITLVDSGSTDDLGNSLLTAFPWVNLIRLKENRGHTVAANVGARSSPVQTRYILFVDNDAFLEPQCLKALITGLPSDESAAMACPKILSAKKPGTLWYGGGYISAFGNAKHIHKPGRYDIPTMGGIEVTYATSCVLLIRRDVFEQVDGFDEVLGNYCEDMDLSVKVKKAGHRILYVPNAVATHGESLNVIKVAGKQFRDYYTTRNGMFLIWKYGTLFQKTVGSVVFIFWYVGVYGIGHGLLGEWVRARARGVGIWDFFRGRMGWKDLL